ncbi:MAG TPA: GNAT family N-acetyltransferase, partial [Gaiellales bacterium]|nr:GNAT family N-acetyltransferase [Gaiellales bacterium]
MSDARIRPATTADVRAVASLVGTYAERGILLGKPLVQLFEDVQDFWVAELEGRVVGCGALHVLWEDLAEVRTVAVHPSARGRGIGHAIVSELISAATRLGV